MTRLYAATGDGIARLEESAGSWTVELRLPGSGAQCLAVDPNDPDIVYAGLRERGVRRTVDAGTSWIDCTLPEPGVFSLAVSAADGAVYAGTEPSRLFRSDDQGERWRELETLLELPSRPTWSFPPRPWTSHVPVDPDDPDCWYVSASTGPYAAHGGGDPQARIYRRQGAEPWRALADGLPEPLPAMPYALLATDGRVFAGLADGRLWESGDRGDTWSALRLEGDPLGGLSALVGAP
jgi:hypothetical protein